MSTPTMTSSHFDFSAREATCFAFALAVHSLLLLWQGGALNLGERAGNGLGDMIGAVGYMTEVPNYDEPMGGGGGSPAPRKGFMSRMKSFVRGEAAAPAAPKGPDIAKGVESAPIEAPKTWAKAEKLSDKLFNKKDFKGMADNDNVQIARGQDAQELVKPSVGNFKTAEPNLKESTFKLAKKDVAFPIVNPKSFDQLSNANAVPVAVGNRTTKSTVDSFDGGPGAGPALKSKSFASSGATASRPSSFGGASGAGSGGSGSGSGGLKMGGGSGTTDGMGGTGTGIGTGSGSGIGSGSGSGEGSGRGSGFGSGRGGGGGYGTGRAWGGSGTGSGSNAMVALPRNTVKDEVRVSAAGKDSGFNITGALRGRGILTKSLPAYEQDARVAIRFRVDWSGRVLEGPLVEISSGSPTFDQKVIAALKRWQFAPLPAGRTNEVQEGVITFLFKGV